MASHILSLHEPHTRNHLYDLTHVYRTNLYDRLRSSTQEVAQPWSRIGKASSSNHRCYVCQVSKCTSTLLISELSLLDRIIGYGARMSLPQTETFGSVIEESSVRHSLPKRELHFLSCRWFYDHLLHSARSYNLASAQAPSTSCKISFIIRLWCWLYNGRDADMYFALRLDTNMLLKNLRTHTMRWSLHWDGEIKGRVILQMWTPLRCVYVVLLPSVRWIKLTMTPHMSPHIYNLARERRMLSDALRLYIAVCPGHHL